jgi:hypothetical protein
LSEDTSKPTRPPKRSLSRLPDLVPALEGESPILREALKRLGSGGSAEGNATFLAVLSADPKPTPIISKFIGEAGKKVHESHNILRVAEELGTPPTEIFLSYARGIQTLGHAIAVERVSEVIASRMEKAIASLMDEAIPREGNCDECWGIGRVGRQKHLLCKKCDGKGRMVFLPENWEFAQKRIYELAGVGPQPGGITIQQNANTNVKGGTTVLAVGAGGFMEKVAALSDDLVSKQLNVVNIVDVVDVTPTNVLTEDSGKSLGVGGEGDVREVRTSLQPEEAIPV